MTDKEIQEKKLACLELAIKNNQHSDEKRIVEVAEAYYQFLKKV